MHRFHHSQLLQIRAVECGELREPVMAGKHLPLFNRRTFSRLCRQNPCSQSPLIRKFPSAYTCPRIPRTSFSHLEIHVLSRRNPQVFWTKITDSDQLWIIGQLAWKNALEGLGNSELVGRTGYQLCQIYQGKRTRGWKC